MANLSEIDLIISTRNRLSELIFTLNHCLNIGFEQEQFNIIDDASTDGTFESIKDKFPKASITRNEKALGYILNRNTLMQKTSNRYILSLDDDSHIRSREDIIEALELLEKKPENGFFHFHPFEQKEAPPLKNDLGTDIRKIRSYIGCGHIIKRSVISDLGVYKPIFEFYCEEMDYSLRAAKYGYVIITKDDLVVHHRIDWKQRHKIKKSKTKEETYGARRRSVLGFSNNLIVVFLHYPIGFDILFALIYIGKRTWHFLIKKGDLYGYLGGLFRFIKFIPYIFRNASKLSINTFIKWIKLAVY